MDLGAALPNTHAHMPWRPTLGLPASILSQATFAQFPIPASFPGQSSLIWQIDEQHLEIHVLLASFPPMSPSCMWCLKTIPTQSFLDLQTTVNNSELVYSRPALLAEFCCALSCCQLSFPSSISMIATCNFLALS